MIAAELQRDLVKEVTKIIKDVSTTKTTGEEVSGATGYEQTLPNIQADEEELDNFFPYFIVKMEEGNTKEDNDPWSVTVSILFGIHDNDPNANGHRHVMVMIQRVADRFTSEPLLNKRFRCQEEMSWALQTEDTYPFYFGGIELKFSVPKLSR